MHRSVGDDKHLAGGGGAAAVGDWFVQSRDKEEEEHLISFASPMQAPPQTAAPATADTEAVPPTMQAMPPQPGRRFCGPLLDSHSLRAWIIMSVGGGIRGVWGQFAWSFLLYRQAELPKRDS